MGDEQHQPSRRVYFRFPIGWSDMSDANKDTWTGQAADALVATASPDGAPPGQSSYED
jgi:hypothetical protein